MIFDPDMDDARGVVDEVAQWVARMLLSSVGEPLPFDTRIMTIEDVRQCVAHYYGPEVAAAVRVTFH